MSEEETILYPPRAAGNLLKRLAYIALSVSFISVSTTLWTDAGYLNIPVLTLVWALLLASGLLLIAATAIKPLRPNRRIDRIFRRKDIVGKILNKFSFVALALFFISTAESLAGTGVHGFVMAVSESALVVVAIALLLVSLSVKSGSRQMENLYLVLLLAGVAFLFAGIVSVLPQFGTDEIAIETYAAYLTLHGIDPYINRNMAGVFSFYHVPFYYLTPVLTGGFVHNLNYPGLSVILMMPAITGWIHSNYVLVFFNLASYPLLFYYYRRKNFTLIFPYAVLILFLNYNWIYYTAGGLTEIIWLFFLAASYVCRNRPLMSGMLYGLSLSSKQTAAAVLPFYLYFIYMEYEGSGRKFMQFILAGVMSFIATNLPFAIMGAGQWFFNIAGVAGQPIIGIGLGPSILSFAGFLPLNRIVFYALPVILTLGLLIIYIGHYSSMKYTLFAFPAIAFTFYYRLLLNYLVYWPFLILLLLPDLMEAVRSLPPAPERAGLSFPRFSPAEMLTERKIGVAAVLFILIGSGMAAGYGYAVAQHNPLRITGIDSYGDPFNIPGEITSMNVTVSYSPSASMEKEIPVYFRILINGAVVSANGMLWSAKNPVIRQGNTTLTIIPDTRIDYVPMRTSFRLIAYYGNLQAVYESAGAYISGIIPIYNPLMLKASYFNTSLPIGWYREGKGAGLKELAYVPGQMELGIKSGGGDTGFQDIKLINKGINMAYLAIEGYSINYSIRISSSGNSTGTHLSASGRLVSFYGAEFSFGNGSMNIMLGFNSSASYSLRQLAPDTLLIISNSTVINFTEVARIALGEQWNIGNATFMYLVGGLVTSNSISATFYGFGIRRV
ncbi:MAG: hypothetical protein KIY12_02185 [Thermoplasmata archaeon]|uniref:Uncharacterized protein n=2 Tax=Candidatus Sysuiplasma superficiale TaxID=2823368 RepID=A0A8J8CFK9_9ARCH|nr:hypothetical protein [Candidatus Sysuiplasma superficiale]MCL4347037.1 hypothetical protein [Candidatus Thermoplasmatota archaeon]